jgi:hypothetical protein
MTRPTICSPAAPIWPRSVASPDARSMKYRGEKQLETGRTAFGPFVVGTDVERHQVVGVDAEAAHRVDHAPLGGTWKATGQRLAPDRSALAAGGEQSEGFTPLVERCEGPRRGTELRVVITRAGSSQEPPVAESPVAGGSRRPDGPPGRPGVAGCLRRRDRERYDPARGGCRHRVVLGLVRGPQPTICDSDPVVVFQDLLSSRGAKDSRAVRPPSAGVASHISHMRPLGRGHVTC